MMKIHMNRPITVCLCVCVCVSADSSIATKDRLKFHDEIDDPIQRKMTSILILKALITTAAKKVSLGILCKTPATWNVKTYFLWQIKQM